MSAKSNPLTKFLVVSAVSFFIGTVHGVLQVVPPIRHWLDRIGSPYGGPGHMIDPLAHAHMNLVGGVVLLAMGVTYHLLPQFVGRVIYSQRLVALTFWCTACGAYAFYLLQVGFGIVEGSIFLTGPSADMAAVHRYYGPSVAVSATVMAVGFFCYLANIALTLRPRRHAAQDSGAPHYRARRAATGNP